MKLRRGCGYRTAGGLYACVPMSADGMPVEWFLTDPVKPWSGGTIRSPMLIKDPRTGVYHFVLGVGASYYPFASDFIEEVRLHGLSKRVPSNLDLSLLTPNKSGMVIVHPRAYPRFPYSVNVECPKKVWTPDLHKDGSLCIGDLWDLSSLHHVEDVHALEYANEETAFEVMTPSTSYKVGRVWGENEGGLMKEAHLDDYLSGSIMFFPKFHFEYVNPDGKAPKELAEPIVAKGWLFKVVDE